MVNRCRAACAALVVSGGLACAGARSAGTRAPPPAAPAGKPALSAPTPALEIVTEPITGMEFVRVGGGCFQMGNGFDDGGGPAEIPVHEVCLDDFYISRYEVSQGDWTAVMESNPSRRSACGEFCPVDSVSWNDVQEFLRKLNDTTPRATPSPYRLPTEAEWEYAARSGGKKQKYAGRDDDLNRIAWYVRNAFEQGPASTGTHPRGLKEPNGLGLYDMTGNAWEWTNDWYDETWYASSPRDNPTGPSSGEDRVLRGGSFANGPFDLRATYRNHLPPDFRGDSKGFRIARSATPRNR